MSQSVTATQLLRNDHRTLRGLFQQARAFKDRDREMRLAALRDLFLLLDTHNRIEQEFFYSELRDHPETSALVEKSLSDHREIVDLAQELEQTDPHAEGYDNGLAELQASIELHVDTEENELFAIAERVLLERLGALGEKMSQRKQELMRAKADIIGQGGEQKRKGASAA